MIKRIARIGLISVGSVLLVMTLDMVWLKVHENALVFAASISRQQVRVFNSSQIPSRARDEIWKRRRMRRL